MKRLPDDQDDPFDLARFIKAQTDDYALALAEVQAGRKRSHWMWYIFPQLRGLGFSEMSMRYGIAGAHEARAYLAHPVLGARLIACCEALLSLPTRSANEVLGSPDDLKLRSSATLFAEVAGDGSVFHRLLDRFFAGEPDPQTLRLLGQRGR